MARQELAVLRDQKGRAVLERILDGKIPHAITGKCSECGADSVGLDVTEIGRLIPTPETMAKVADLTYRYTVPQEKIVRLEGPRDAALVFETIKARIRLHVGSDKAEELIADIHRALIQR
jgi:hypothetical protein